VSVPASVSVPAPVSVPAWLLEKQFFVPISVDRSERRFDLVLGSLSQRLLREDVGAQIDRSKFL
jgi:hypothetical protein